MQGGLPYYRPFMCKRYALDLKDKFNASSERWL